MWHSRKGKAIAVAVIATVAMLAMLPRNADMPEAPALASPVVTCPTYVVVGSNFLFMGSEIEVKANLPQKGRDAQVVVEADSEPEHRSLTFLAGWEFSGVSYPEFTGQTGAPAVDGTIKNTGYQSMKVAVSNGVGYVEMPYNYRASFYIYADTLPSVDCKVIGGTVGEIYVTTTGEVDLYRGGVKKIDGTTQLLEDTWCRISYSSNLDADEVKYWIDGNLEGSLSEALCGGTTGGNIGVITTCTTTMYFDDIVLDNEQTILDVGDVRVLPVLPDGEGFHQDHGSGTYQSIDEPPKDTSDADQVFLEANGSLIEYSCNIQDRADLGIDSGATIEAVKAYFNYITAGGGDPSYFTLVRDNATDYTVAVDDIKSNTWVFRDIDVVEPNSGTAWDWTSYDAFQIGMATDDANKDMWINTAGAYLCYIPPSGACAEDISNTPATWDVNSGSPVAINTTYWSKGSAPTFPLDDAECQFTVTNSSGGAINITIQGANFIGGVGWTISSSNGVNTVVLKGGKSGDANEGAMVTLTTSPQAFISGLGDSATKKWELMILTATEHGDSVAKTTTLTLSATCQ